MTTEVALNRPGGAHSTAAWLRALFRRRPPVHKRDTRLPSARRRIALWAVAIGLVAGSIELLMPIEDSYRAIRAMVREHPSDQGTVVVLVDDGSLDVLGVNDPLRADDAKVLEQLFRLGAKRVFFDRAYADAGSPGDDAQLVTAMKRHRGKVFIGATSLLDDAAWTLFPSKTFRSAAEIVSINGQEGPLGLSTHFPTSTTVKGVERPSLSAQLAGIDDPGRSYRIDFAIDYKTIPTARYIDILRGRGDSTRFAGKDVVIAPSGRTSSDFHPIPFNTRLPGALLHVIGAETLRAGVPVDLGWLPAFLPICLFVAFQVRRRRPSNRQNAIAFAALALVPFGLDFASVSIDIMPALLCLGIASVRYARLARDSYRGATGLQNFAVLQRSRADDQVDVIALKIRNFATISALMSPEQIEQLLVKAQAMLQATDHSAEFAFDKDTFVWLASRLRQGDLEDHLRGLHALFSTSITVGAQAPDIGSRTGSGACRSCPSSKAPSVTKMSRCSSSPRYP